MRVKALLLCCAVAMLASSAQAVYLETFDSYANQAALNAAWTPATTAISLDNDGTPVPVSSPNTVYQGTGAQASYMNLGVANSVQLRRVDFSFDFYDGGTALGRTYALLESRGTTGTDPRTATLNQIIAIGKNNGATTTKYSGRVAFGSVGWVSLDAATSPNRSVGWHVMRIAADGAAAPTLTFYVDGLVGKQVALSQAQGDVLMNWIQVGSNLTSSTTSNFDNIKVAPEPVTALFLVIGGLMFARRRHA